MVGLKSGEIRALRRTAREVKRYRILMKLLPAIAALLTMTVAITYVISVMYNKYGSFTVMVNKFDSVQYALTLAEDPEFLQPTMRLNSKASEEITNISVRDLPEDLDRINGEHNGRNYVAYTFYMKNAGTAAVDCEYEVYIANMSLDIEKAVRVRLYVNGVYEDYARTKTDGTGAEPGTVPFYSETVIVKDRLNSYQPEEVTRFTVVIWLEGDDPDCIDNILGGQFKIDMAIRILGIDEDAA